MSDAFLDEVLADPETHEPVHRATDEQLAAAREAIAQGRARRHGGGELPSELSGGYVSGSGRWLYPDAEGFASLLVEDRIELDEPV